MKMKPKKDPFKGFDIVKVVTAASEMLTDKALKSLAVRDPKAPSNMDSTGIRWRETAAGLYPKDLKNWRKIIEELTDTAAVDSFFSGWIGKFKRLRANPTEFGVITGESESADPDFYFRIRAFHNHEIYGGRIDVIIDWALIHG